MEALELYLDQLSPYINLIQMGDDLGTQRGPLLGPDGKALEGKNARDAESLALLADGSFVVGFERQQRLLLLRHAGLSYREVAAV